jgi:hypothetical protein
MTDTEKSEERRSCVGCDLLNGNALDAGQVIV